MSSSIHSKFRILVLALVLGCNSSASQAATSTVGVGHQPQAISSRHQSIIAYGGADGAIYSSTSTDAGKTFQKPVKVGTAPHMALGMRRGPRIAAADGALIIAAVGGEQGGGKDGDVLAWRSTDDGRSWKPLPKPLNRVPGAAREGLHAIAGDAGKWMLCAWLDLRNVKQEKGGTDIWGSVSSDAGASWSDDFLIYHSPDRTVCQCCHPSVAIDNNGRMSLMFRNALGGNRDMYIVRSTDHGKTFGEALKLGQKSWALDACPMDGGSFSFTKRSGAPELTAWRRGDDILVASAGADEEVLGRGQQPWVTIDRAGVPYFTWITGRPGDLMLKVGEGKPEKIAEGALDPSISADRTQEGPVILVWESGGSVMAMDVSKRK